MKLTITSMLLLAGVARAQTVAVDVRLAGPPSTSACSGGQPTAAATSACERADKKPAQDRCKKAIAVACKPVSAEAAPVAPAAGVSWQGAVLSGVSDFLAERTQAEVMAWFEDLVRNDLCALTYDDGSGQKKKWFAATCELLEDKSGSGRQLTSLVLVEAVRADLELLGQVVIKHYLAKDPVLVATVGVAAGVVYSLRRGESPIALVAGLAHDDRIRDRCKGQTSPTPECLLAITGLVVEYGGNVVNAFASARAAGQSVTESKLEEILAKVLAAKKLACAISNLYRGQPSDASCDDGHELDGIPAEIAKYLELGTAFSADYEPKLLALLRSIGALDGVARDGTMSVRDRALAIVAALNDVLAAAGDLVPGQKETFARVAQGFRVISELISQQYAKGIRDLIALADAEKTPLPDAVRKYAALVVEMADARSAKDVRTALENAAAPVGGWKIKHDKWGASVTAFVGGMAGGEWPEADVHTDQALGGGWSAGLFAPVGIDVAGPAGTSMGVLFSVLDLGQLTWARLSDVTQANGMVKANVETETGFVQVLSPGAYLHFGLGNSPFTAGAGVSYAPALRNYTFLSNGQPTKSDLSSLRLGLFLAVDVTILPF